MNLHKIKLIAALLIIVPLMSCISYQKGLAKKLEEKIKQSDHGFIAMTLPAGVLRESARHYINLKVKVDGKKYWTEVQNIKEKKEGTTFQFPVAAGKHEIKIIGLFQDQKPFKY